MGGEIPPPPPPCLSHQCQEAKEQESVYDSEIKWLPIAKKSSLLANRIFSALSSIPSCQTSKVKLSLKSVTPILAMGSLLMKEMFFHIFLELSRIS